MRLHEYEADDIFEAAGIPVPRRGVAQTPEEAANIAADIAAPVVLKAQVLVGGRGKAGGVKFADSPQNAHIAAKSLFSNKIKGFTPQSLLVAQRADIVRECYLGVTVDGAAGMPVVIVSDAGGMSVEQAARTAPDRLTTCHVEPGNALSRNQALELFDRLGFPERERGPFADILTRLYSVFLDYDALIAEINPLAVCADSSLSAVDAVLEVDNSALFRLRGRVPNLTERIDNPLERRGRKIGVTYVDLDGDIGLISSGAGLGMATMDVLSAHLRPANFLETGGGITDELLYNAMDLVLSKPGIRAVLVTVYGGINPIHEGAKGIVRYIRDHDVRIPVVAKALGNRQEETWDILRSGGVHVVTDVATETAVAKLVKLLGRDSAPGRADR